MKTLFDTHTFEIPAGKFHILNSYNSFITLLRNSSSTAVKIRIGGGSARSQLYEGLSVGLPRGELFKSILFENTASETMTITVALSLAPIDNFQRRITAQPAITVTNAAADTNTVAASNGCSKVLIQAPTTNGGTTWIDLGAVAVDGSCFELIPGAPMSVSLLDTVKINALFKVANDKIIIIYEV